MGWMEINYACGHVDREQMYGPTREREKRVEWKERGVCPDCWRAEKEEERKQENERAANLQNTIGFALLTGSEKQIAWAVTLRQKIYEAIVRSADPHPLHGYSLIAEILSLELSAKWWIDNRNCNYIGITEMIAANYPTAMQAITAKGAQSQAV